MIVEWLLGAFWSVISFILSFFPSFPALEGFNQIISYISFIFEKGGSLFFLLIPKTAFDVAIDVVFFFWIYEPMATFIMWILRKIPFLGIE